MPLIAAEIPKKPAPFLTWNLLQVTPILTILLSGVHTINETLSTGDIFWLKTKGGNNNRVVAKYAHLWYNDCGKISTKYIGT